VETDMFMSYQISVGEYGKIKTVDLKVRHKQKKYITASGLLNLLSMPRDRFSKLYF
jgi:hypothetical protein